MVLERNHFLIPLICFSLSSSGGSIFLNEMLILLFFYVSILPAINLLVSSSNRRAFDPLALSHFPGQLHPSF